MVDMEMSERIGKMQILEQNMQALIMQKQQFQAQLFELDSALKEIAKTDKAYKIVGNIMVGAEKNELEKELKQKREIVELRLSSIEKQEKQFREKAQQLQDETLGKLKKK